MHNAMGTKILQYIVGHLENISKDLLFLAPHKSKSYRGLCRVPTYLLDVLWGQPIKLIQVVSTSEFHEY